MLIGNTVGYPPQGCAAEGSPNEPACQYDGSGQLISVEDDQKFPDEDDLSHDGHESDEEEGKGDPPFHRCYLREADRIKQGPKGGTCSNWSSYGRGNLWMARWSCSPSGRKRIEDDGWMKRSIRDAIVEYGHE